MTLREMADGAPRNAVSVLAEMARTNVPNWRRTAKEEKRTGGKTEGWRRVFLEGR